MFSILSKRSKGNYSEEELSLMSKKEQRYLNGWLSVTGTSAVRLTDEDSKSRIFTFGSFKPMDVVAAFAAPFALNSLLPGFGFAAFLAQKGSVVEAEEKGQFYDDRIDFSISREQYDLILDDMLTNTTRVYNSFARNCSTFALETARKGELEIDKPLFLTPNGLSDIINSMAIEYKSVHIDFGRVDEKLDLLFSDHRPTPPTGRPVTLLDRLTSENGLELDL